MHRSTAELLVDIFRQPLAVQSNQARAEAAAIGYLASNQYITTWEGTGEKYGRYWRVTARGGMTVESAQVSSIEGTSDSDYYIGSPYMTDLFSNEVSI